MIEKRIPLRRRTAQDFGERALHKSRTASRAASGQRHVGLALDQQSRDWVSSACQNTLGRAELLGAKRSARVPPSSIAANTAATNSVVPWKFRLEHHLARMAALRGLSTVVSRAVCASLKTRRHVASEAGAPANAGSQLQLFTEGGERPRGTHRYQVVFDRGERVDAWFVIELWLDPDERLLEWSRGTESLQFPKWASLGEVRAEILRMYIDACSWRPVAYGALKRGFSFERMISIEERARLAEAFDKMQAVMAESQAKTLMEHRN